MKHILPHEHMVIDLSPFKNDKDCLLNVYKEDKSELADLKRQNVKAMFDCSNRGMSRDMNYLNKIESEYGIQVFSGTGYYKDPFMPHEVVDLSVNELARIMIEELTEGIDHGRKASFIGEIGTSLNKWTDSEKKVFEAAVIAHQQTGAPILTHTTLGTLGLEQIEFFKSYNIDMKKIIISHVDLKEDYEYIVQLLDEGVYVGFDTVGKLSYLSDETRLQWIFDLIQAGYEKQIFISLDITRQSHLKKNNGIGYAYLFDTFIPMLIEKGVSESTIEQITYQNPLDWIGVELND